MAVGPQPPDLASIVPKVEIHLHLEGSIDLDTLLEWDQRHGGLAAPLIRMITDLEAFKATIQERPDNFVRRSSNVQQQARQLLEWDIASPAPTPAAG